MKEKLKYPNGVKFILSVYIFLSVFVILAIVVIYLVEPKIEMLQNYSLLLVFTMLPVYGISKKKPWIVSFMYILSSSGVLFSFIALNQMSLIGLEDFVIAGMGFFFLLFHPYSLIVFLRSETKHFFNESGSIFL